jgi:dTDP-4-dehydrorhamnose 3,5-epimerase
MKFKKLAIEDVVLIETDIYSDERGYFSEVYRQDKLEDFVGRKLKFCQDNESRSYKNVFRGMHYQLPPFAQSKLINVKEGEILDIILDIRKDSPTFLKSISIKLSVDNRKRLFIPKGFAHGFLVLSDFATISYKVDSYYSKKCERIININDPIFKKHINLLNLNISEKDLQAPFIKDAMLFDYDKNYYE